MEISAKNKAKAKASFILGLITSFICIIFLFLPILSVYQSYELGNSEFNVSVYVSIFDFIIGNTEKTVFGLESDMELNFRELLFMTGSEEANAFLSSITFYLKLSIIVFFVIVFVIESFHPVFSVHSEQVYIKKFTHSSLCVPIILVFLPAFYLIVTILRISASAYYDTVFVWQINYIYPSIIFILVLIPTIVCNCITKKARAEIMQSASSKPFDIPLLFSNEEDFKRRVSKKINTLSKFTPVKSELKNIYQPTSQNNGYSTVQNLQYQQAPQMYGQQPIAEQINNVQQPYIPSRQFSQQIYQQPPQMYSQQPIAEPINNVQQPNVHSQQIYQQPPMQGAPTQKQKKICQRCSTNSDCDATFCLKCGNKLN